MELSNAEHSDSDSGESWTLLDPTPSYGDTAPDFHGKTVRKDGDITDKDEDTDGISIISDSEPECCHCQPIDPFNYEIIEEDPEPEQNMEEEPVEAPSDDPDELLSCDDLLGNTSTKKKTYVHRRNKKLSTVLNLIILFSVITAVGVAIGHMWGVRDDCTQHSLSNVNKILSKLYKLQEENVILRNKIRELTLANTFQFEYNKDDFENPPAFKRKFKKVFDDKFASTSMCYVTYVDESGNPVNNNRVDQNIETANADKLDRLDDNKPKADYCILINDKRKRDYGGISANERYKLTRELDLDRFGRIDSTIAEKVVGPINKSSEQIKDEKNSKSKVQFSDKTNINLKKEFKQQRKLKNKNEAKGEKEDYAQYKKYAKNARIDKAPLYKLDDYETDVSMRHAKPKQDKGDYGWYEKRAVHRMEARKKSFGDMKQDGSAGWYFRRMHRREQCRNKPVNLTNKKANKMDGKN